ncbi:MAG: hypothetical protein AAGG51_08865 [Cyanobacteria bacterium P01_G01_bin.54]
MGKIIDLQIKAVIYQYLPTPPLSNNDERITHLDRCRQHAQAEGTISLGEVRRRLATMDNNNPP